ncbi:MAG TPA: hypothetical protein PLM98_09220, partial [Thiolinea sp.]|nr:hypothetical protein [Thiolinea sp.]
MKATPIVPVIMVMLCTCSWYSSAVQAGVLPWSDYGTSDIPLPANDFSTPMHNEELLFPGTRPSDQVGFIPNAPVPN